VRTAAGTEVPVRYRVVEASELRTSDHPEYPAELQPRDRTRGASATQIASIAANLAPESLGPSSDADRGAPIVGPDGVVESGNGRVMAIRRAYAEHPEKAAAYRDYVSRVTNDSLSGFKEPVLVAERALEMTPEQRQAFTREANVSATAAMSDTERAGSDAAAMDESVLGNLQPGDLTSSANAAFRKAFIGKVAEAERGAFVDKDGNLSQAGVRRMQAAILHKAYGGSKEATGTLSRIIESTDDNARSISGAMIDVAPQFARLRQSIADGKVGGGYDLSRQMIEAIEAVSQLRESGGSVKEWLQQTDMFGARDKGVEELVKAFYNPQLNRAAGRDRIADILRLFADEAMRSGQSAGDIFGDSPATAAEILRSGKEQAYRDERGAGEQGNLLGGPGSAAAGAAAGGEQAGRPGAAAAGGRAENVPEGPAEPRVAPAPAPARKPLDTYTVHVTFQYPAWDEKDGFTYEVQATSKSEANKRARTLAERDGHAVTGRGRVYFKATKQEPAASPAPAPSEPEPEPWEDTEFADRIRALRDKLADEKWANLREQVMPGVYASAERGTLTDGSMLQRETMVERALSGKPLGRYEPAAEGAPTTRENSVNESLFSGDDTPVTISAADFKEVRDEWANLFSDPGPPVITDRRAREAGFITQEEADARLEQWREHARSQNYGGSRKSSHRRGNSDLTVLSLFDHTGAWSAPWVEAGYNVIQMDIQDGHDVHDFSAEYFIENWDFSDVYAILVAVPCTDFASSGARWFADKDADGRTEVR
jgi:hypothetical protein